MTAVARFAVVALDTTDTERLAVFYSAITGWEIEPHDSTKWIQLRAENGATIAFQEVAELVPPQWPGSEHPQRLHLDFDVPDLDAGEERVVALGARKAEYQPGTSFRVFLDPTGHPFCLVEE